MSSLKILLVLIIFVRMNYHSIFLEYLIAFHKYVIFWPSAWAKCHSRWCTGMKWHIPMAVMWGNRVGGNWLMKWDKLKKFPWYTHRLMHQKRVTSELHDSYFRLMMIKHSISKIEWASNNYIIQLSLTSQWSCK